MAKEKNVILQKAQTDLDYILDDDELKRLADLQDMWEMDRVSELSDAKEEGIEEGLEKGLKKGLKNGLEEGQKMGRKKGQKDEKLNIAKAMLKKGLPIELISEITKLSKDEIKNLNL